MRVSEDKPTAFLDTSPGVGGTYHPHRQRWDEHIQYEYSQGMHELRVCLNGLKAAEIDAIVRGEAGFALVVDGPLLLLLFRFEGALNWSDAPFTIWRLQDARRSVPAAPTSGERALLHVHVVDAEANTLVAARRASLPPAFSHTLIAAIRYQVGEPYEATEYARRLEALKLRYPTTLALLDRAVARCRIPAHGPVPAEKSSPSRTSPDLIVAESALECPTTDALLPLRAALLNLLEEQDADERGDRGTEIHALLTSRDAPRLQLDSASADLERLSAAGSRRDFRDLAPDCTPVRPGLWTEWVDSRTGMRQGCALLVVPSHIKLHEGRVDSRYVVEWQLFAHFAAVRSDGSAGFAMFSMVALIDPRGRLIPEQPILPHSASGNLEHMQSHGQVALQTALLGLSRMNTGHAERLAGENSYVA